MNTRPHTALKTWSSIGTLNFPPSPTLRNLLSLYHPTTQTSLPFPYFLNFPYPLHPDQPFPYFNSPSPLHLLHLPNSLPHPQGSNAGTQHLIKVITFDISAQTLLVSINLEIKIYIIITVTRVLVIETSCRVLLAKYALLDVFFEMIKHFGVSCIAFCLEKYSIRES